MSCRACGWAWTASGTAATPTRPFGLSVPTSNNLIGGTTAQQRNVIGGTGWAI
jgi:hypothetical protein